jgi:hypothetical protein
MIGSSGFDIEKADEVDNGFPHPEGKCRIPKLACEAGHGNEHRSPGRKQSSTQDEMAFGNDRIVAFAVSMDCGLFDCHAAQLRLATQRSHMTEIEPLKCWAIL